MNYIDVFLLIVIAIGFILGYKDGIIRKLIGLAGFILAVYFAIILAGSLGKAIENVFGIEYYLSEMIAGAVIFLSIVLIFSIIKRLVHPYDKVNNLLNQMLGGFVGVVQLLFFVSAFLYLLNIFGFPDKRTSQSSLLYSPVYHIIPAAVDMVGGYTESKKIIKEYIIEKDTLK